MSPIDWATRPLKKYADFSGRAPRAEFWWFYLLMVIVYVAAVIVDTMIGSKIFGPYGLVACLIFLALLLPYLAVAVRRLHDTNRSGWWMAAPLSLYAIGFALIGPATMSSMASGDASAMTGLGTASIFILLGVILGIVVLVFFLLPGTRGPNQYGDDPYAGGAARAM